METRIMLWLVKTRKNCRNILKKSHWCSDHNVSSYMFFRKSQPTPLTCPTD